jgi:hypothetical protein
MEHKKKKNGVDRSHRIRFAFILIIFTSVLFMGCGIWANFPFPHNNEAGFNQTATSIIATNDRVATLIMQTDVVATKQFMLTGTALP